MNYGNQFEPQPQDDSTTNNLMRTIYNNPYGTDASTLHIRLDTESLLEKIQLFLEGRIKVVKVDAQGMEIVELKQISKPKANEEGIHSLMFFISSSVNIPVVQGNYKEEWYRMYCGNLRQSLNDSILLNQDEWGIKDTEYELICDTIMATIEPFMTRTLEDKERGHIGQSTQTVERIGNESQNNGGLFSFLRR